MRKIAPIKNTVLVKDLLDNSIRLFNSKRAAALFFGVTTATISQREKRNSITPYKNRYIIEFPSHKQKL